MRNGTDDNLFDPAQPLSKDKTEALWDSSGCPPTMPVAIRKRSWEEHVTHPSGLKYSFDDLDLVCCHGVDGSRPWNGAETSQKGRRTRCASMPEGCPLLSSDDLTVTCEGTSTFVEDNAGSKEMNEMKKQENISSDSQDVDVVGAECEFENLDAESKDHSGEYHCDSNGHMSCANLSGTTVTQRLETVSVEVGVESCYNICTDANAFKRPHVLLEGQQCISISSNNGLPLSGSAGVQTGKHSNHQETKERHTEGYSRPAENPGATLNWSLNTAEGEPPTDMPDVEKEKISTSEHADASRNFTAGPFPGPFHVMEAVDIMCPAGEPVATVASHSETWSEHSFAKPRIKNDLETLNENTEVKPQSGDNGGNHGHPDCTGVLDQTGYDELAQQNSLELTNITVTQMNTQEAVESPEAGSCGKSNQVRYGAAASPDISPKGQLCSTLVGSCVSYEKADAAFTGREECVDQSISAIPTANETNISSDAGDELTFCVDEGNFENSCKLDTILEVSCVEPDDPAGSLPHNDSIFISCQTDKHLIITQQQDHRLTSRCAEVNAELPSEGNHGNRASGCDLTASPASEVTDGQREDHRPGAVVSNMEETDEAAHVDAHLSCRTNEAEEPEVTKDGTVRMRTRKPEHARLDSMVLLLMKLDQLDQEIENALSATSSIDSTPTLHRRPLVNTLSIPEQEKAEIEAKEACTWLRAAGFPQYAQLYEDALFPIDISSVTRDHDFLDRDAIEALCRRLNTLNKCALMRLEISPQRKRSEDSDEDELCAISGRWTFQRDSKRWSRMEELEVFSTLSMDDKEASSFPKDHVSQKGKHVLHEGNSSESVLTDLSEQPEVVSIHSSGSGGRGEEKGHGATLVNQSTPAGATRANSVTSMCSSSGTGGSGCANEDSLSDGLPPSPLESLGQFTFDMKSGLVGLGGSLERGSGSSKSTRSRAKSFLKRMESLRLRSSSTSKRKKKGSITGGKIEISGPVIKEGLDDDKLRRLNCVDIPSINFHQNLNHHRNPTQTMTLNRNRSISYSTQTSNGSTGSSGSSQSEASSGSAVSTPSPVTRARSHSTAAGSSKRGGMYLEGFDPLGILQQASDRQPKPPPNCQATNGMTVHEQNHKNNYSFQSNGGELGEEEEEEDEGMLYFYLPEGHKPGTFPKALEDGCSRNNNGIDNGNLVVLRGRQSRRQRRGSSGSVDSRLSFYDNVPYTEREEEVEEEGDEGKLEEVLKHVSGLKHFNAWSEAVAGEEEEEEEEDEEEEGDSDSALDSASPCPSSPLQNRLEETENGSDQDSTGNPLGEGEEGIRERRDSGVGASLTRTSRPQKLRWPSFQNSHRPSLASAQLQISCQSVLQMNLLQKLSLLQLTALLEKHTPANKHGFSWAVPKFMKRIKVRDYKDRNVFGVPLQVIVQRTGQPLPQGIQQAMRFLRNQCLDQVGLFRKSGVKSRIQALRQMNEASGADGGGVSYEGQSAYDVADMLKQYFRDLPEPLLTSKLSETFLQIYQYMPKELRLQAARAAVLLLPDENREALRTLLCFLSDVTASVAENQMTPTNLAVCLAPSLFHLNTLRRKESSSPRVMNRKQILGKPDQKDLNENLAATHGVAHMIQECRKLFRIPEEMNRCRNSYMEQALLPRCIKDLEEDENGGYRTYLRNLLDALLKEAKDKFRGYDSCSTPEHAELACRKVHDGFPLRQWKVTIEVPATPEEVLTRILREQAHWDEDLLESRVVETLDDKMEIYQYVRNTMAPHPTRDHVVLRSWVTDLPKGACALVSTSVDHEGAPVVGVRANVLTSRYFIEPCGSNKSRLTHISRIDCRGRFPEWYNKLYGHLCAAEVVRIRESFSAPLDK